MMASQIRSYGHNYSAQRKKPGFQKKKQEKVKFFVESIEMLLLIIGKVGRDVRKLPKHLIGRYQAPEISSNPGRDVMVVQSQNMPTSSQNVNIFTHKI